MTSLKFPAPTLATPQDVVYVFEKSSLNAVSVLSGFLTVRPGEGGLDFQGTFLHVLDGVKEIFREDFIRKIS